MGLSPTVEAKRRSNKSYQRLCEQHTQPKCPISKKQIFFLPASHTNPHSRKQTPLNKPHHSGLCSHRLKQLDPELATPPLNKVPRPTVEGFQWPGSCEIRSTKLVNATCGLHDHPEIGCFRNTKGALCLCFNLLDYARPLSLDDSPRVIRYIALR
jgi:hypothetical protein